MRVNELEGDVEEVIGRLGYIRATEEIPISHPSEEPDLENLDWDWRDLPIGNARKLPGGPSLQRNGFTTLPHATKVTDWEGEGWQKQFEEEAVEIVRQATGAARVIVTPYSFLPRSTTYPADGGPLSFCHNDYTAGSAARHIAKDFPELAPDFYRKRYAIYNLWHLISPPPQSYPLALCDPTTVAISDLIPGDAQAGPRDNVFSFGENSMFRYNPAHRWYYFPDLGNDETLVWCGYDSDPAFPSIVPHAAFKDPSCTDPNAQRTNVHGAVYAFFD